jgi:hypothetical protein
MFKSKGAILGVTVALVASALLVAGMAVKTTSGAGTDLPFGGAPSGALDPGDAGTGNPPAAEEEPGVTDPGTGSPAGTTPGTQPTTGIDPTGGAGAGGAAPGTLPSAGFGVGGDATSFGVTVILLAVAGAALMGAGATAVSRRS